jgi:hypothetical protein
MMMLMVMMTIMTTTTTPSTTAADSWQPGNPPPLFCSLQKLEVDTCHFKGNFPESCQLEAALLPHVTDPQQLLQMQVSQGGSIVLKDTEPSNVVEGSLLWVFVPGSGEGHEGREGDDDTNQSLRRN